MYLCEKTGKMKDMNDRNLAKEINEAVNAANDALYYLGNAEEKLKSAQRWGIADILGGQMIISAVKHSKIQDAEEEVDYACKALEKLNKELGDVGEFYEIDNNIGGLLSAIDVFMDNPITDLITQSRINDTLDKVKQAIAQVEGVLDALEDITAERG